jgi:predicted nucleotidyltransferase
MALTSFFHVDLNATEKDVARERIAHLCERIVEAVQPRQIVLFGSHAQEEARPGSDVDLLVRTPEDVARNLADRNPFYTRHIFEEGTTLYERS